MRAADTNVLHPVFGLWMVSVVDTRLFVTLTRFCFAELSNCSSQRQKYSIRAPNIQTDRRRRVACVTICECVESIQFVLKCEQAQYILATLKYIRFYKNETIKSMIAARPHENHIISKAMPLPMNLLLFLHRRAQNMPSNARRSMKICTKYCNWLSGLE